MYPTSIGYIYRSFFIRLEVTMYIQLLLILPLGNFRPEPLIRGNYLPSSNSPSLAEVGTISSFAHKRLTGTRSEPLQLMCFSHAKLGWHRYDRPCDSSLRGTVASLRLEDRRSLPIAMQSHAPRPPRILPAPAFRSVDLELEGA